MPPRSSNPTGFCSHELATMMKNADAYAVTATPYSSRRCTPRRSRCHPKIHIPRNVDSRKNATSVSIATGAPNTLPT